MILIRRMLQWTFLILVLPALADTASPLPVFYVGVYHEATCPFVDTTRMVRIKRYIAESMGLYPAFDCHPDARVRYLGVGPSGPSPSRAESIEALGRSSVPLALV
jgi:hypothetical protein